MPETFWIRGMTKKGSRHADKAHRLPGAWVLYCGFFCHKGAPHERCRPTETSRPALAQIHMAFLNPRGSPVQIQHIGYRIKGFYRVAKIGHRWNMNPHAQKRIDILRFWEVHGTAAICDAFKVSRHPSTVGSKHSPSPAATWQQVRPSPLALYRW